MKTSSSMAIMSMNIAILKFLLSQQYQGPQVLEVECEVAEDATPVVAEDAQPQPQVLEVEWEVVEEPQPKPIPKIGSSIEPWLAKDYEDAILEFLNFKRTVYLFLEEGISTLEVETFLSSKAVRGLMKAEESEKRPDPIHVEQDIFVDIYGNLNLVTVPFGCDTEEIDFLPVEYFPDLVCCFPSSKEAALQFYFNSTSCSKHTPVLQREKWSRYSLVAELHKAPVSSYKSL